MPEYKDIEFFVGIDADGVVFLDTDRNDLLEASTVTRVIKVMLKVEIQTDTIVSATVPATEVNVEMNVQ